MAEEKFTNSICRDLGSHSWVSTTAPNYRVCQRSGCHAVQVLKLSNWVDIPSRSTKRQQSNTQSQPVSLQEFEI